MVISLSPYKDPKNYNIKKKNVFPVVTLIFVTVAIKLYMTSRVLIMLSKAVKE
jgi:hypothetical protein